MLFLSLSVSTNIDRVLSNLDIEEKKIGKTMKSVGTFVVLHDKY